MNDIFRIFECRCGILTELVFIISEQSARDYLTSCRNHNTDPDTFYFAQKLKLEK